MAFVGMAPFGSLLAGPGACDSADAIWSRPMAGRMDGDCERLVVVLGAAWFFTQLPALRRDSGQSIRRWASSCRRESDGTVAATECSIQKCNPT